MDTISEVPVRPSEVGTLAKAVIVEGLVGDLVQPGRLVDANKRQVVGIFIHYPLEALLDVQILDKGFPTGLAELGHGGVLLDGGRESTWNSPSRSRLEYKDLAEAVL